MQGPREEGSWLNCVWLSSDTYCVQGAVSDGATLSSSSRDTGGREAARSAFRFLESVIDRYVVVVSASVRVEYQGRASSVADTSQRIVVTKPDGTLIIHEDTKHRPLNWQPPGTRFHLSLGDGTVPVLEAFRKKDRETVTIWFEKIFYIAASRIAAGEFRFSGSEQEMVERVVADPGLIEEGFVPEKREMRTRYGSVDLMGKDRDGNTLLLEFKRRCAQLSSASQLDRYVEYFVEMERLRRALELRKERSTESEGTAEDQEESGVDNGEAKGGSGSLRTRAGGRTDRRGRSSRRRRRRMRRIKIRGGIVAPAITPEALTFLRKLGYEFFKLEPRVEVFDSVSPQRPSEDQGVTQSAPE